MSWLGNVGEFCGSFAAAFVKRRAITKSRTLGSTKEDEIFHLSTVMSEGLGNECLPIEDHVTRRGLNQVCKALETKDNFRADKAIAANPGPNQRLFCLKLINYAVTHACSENAINSIRAATFNLLCA